MSAALLEGSLLMKSRKWFKVTAAARIFCLFRLNALGGFMQKVLRILGCRLEGILESGGKGRGGMSSHSESGSVPTRFPIRPESLEGVVPLDPGRQGDRDNVVNVSQVSDMSVVLIMKL